MLGNVQIQKMLVSSFAGNMLQSWCIIDPTGCFSNTLHRLYGIVIKKLHSYLINIFY